MSTRLALMFRRWLMAGLGLSLMLVWATDRVRAATIGARATSEEELVKEALHRELYGLDGERVQLLNEAIQQNPHYGPAQWQRGYVLEGGQWVDVDSLFLDSQSPLLKEYFVKREKLVDTIDGHMSLANWCRDHKLAMQERAHLWRILDLNPEHAVARDRLGYRQVAGVWMTTDEVSAAADRREKEAAASARWRTELLDIARDLQQPNAQRRATARQRLAMIQDVYAIPIMETVLSGPSEEGSLAVIDVVARMSGQEPVESLIRHAILSPWPLVREAAAEQLRQRRRESYVPALLSEMYTPLVSQFGVAQLPNGRLGYRHIFHREGQEERQVLLLDTEYRRVRRMGGDGDETLVRAFMDSLTGLAQREVVSARQNFLQMTLNQRVAEVLNIATNQQLPADPHPWWQWWDEENDVIRISDKQTRSRQQFRQVAIADRRPQFVGSGGEQVGPPARQAECFAAGTMVCTRQGQQPIETIRVGDVVLAQNVESGELAFKPVLRTTVRPAGELTKVVVGRDELQTSGGHLYWVAGHGWAKARRLESGMPLHCLRGSVPITCVEKGTEAQTYNLVVADFHTYFVGGQRVLSHDVTLRRPTEAIVPGLKVE